ncbi:small glutamine-rich tetratricopeptide repeat-containing protein beta [Ixodes scapularis]|uniref:Secreted protein n=2 Tax=Ixodes TaxID=6944 RepID=B7Q815_IXOSC|nr:small glutamine-rich tetratricopeptide repeat-containing protein beta [Ixodes scapularis]EEC14987.1 secreted protein [Ixodes scapularis]|eukprot:XP_002404605.1 secreted protein [Ixodes scapularis]
MSHVKRLVLSIVQFLRQQLQTADLSSDAKESVEVAVQCLETAYGVSIDDLSNDSLLVSRTLLDIFREVVVQEHAQVHETLPEPTEAQRAEAEKYKQEGNNMMKLEMYTAALECYTKAISLDGNNAVYYCNRAAAHSKLNNHADAIEDCQRALDIDPKYGKAYGRIGLAYASLNEHQRAKECYQKAVELDPENQSYINNLRVAEEKLRGMPSPGNGDARRAGGVGGGAPMDFGSLLNNPTLMNMAATLMQDPTMQNMMAGLMSGGMSQNTGGGLDALLQAGQQLASQMQASNPELVEQLRRHMSNSNSSDASNQDPSAGNPDADN